MTVDCRLSSVVYHGRVLEADDHADDADGTSKRGGGGAGNGIRIVSGISLRSYVLANIILN